MKVYDVDAQIKKIETDSDKMIDSFMLAPLQVANTSVKLVTKPVEPAICATNTAKKTIEDVNQALRAMITRILFSTRHANIAEAMLADLVDIIPGLGDVTEAERLSDARRLGDHDAMVAHGMDTMGEIFDIIPVAGEIIDSVLDALVPANTLLYLKRRGYIEWHPPLPPIPNLNAVKK